MSMRPSAFAKQKLSIVVPVFNEAPRILKNLNWLVAEVGTHFDNYEIIVVCDGSTDDTAAKVVGFQHPRVHLVVLVENKGKGGALRAGFKAAVGDYILFIDGGMEIHPREIHIFMGLMALYKCDIVIGSKRHPQSRVYYPWYRRLLSAIFQQCVRALFKVNVTDTQVGIKLFHAPVIHAVLPQLELNRYGFDLEILSLAKLHGYDKVLEAPIQLDYFMNQNRFIIPDLLHVLRVGSSLLKDTFMLYLRLRKFRFRGARRDQSFDREQTQEQKRIGHGG